MLRELVRYWRDDYAWERSEERINALPQFVVDVDGRAVHFVWQQARGFPVLLLHGWPDSFHRFHAVLPMFPERFDVVVPSLPGFAFTRWMPGREQPMRQTATLMWRLMTEVLGYARFGVAGGDTGSAIAQLLAIDHPESVVGIHLTDIGWHAANVETSTLSRRERAYIKAVQQAFKADGAYAMVQTTRPRSLAVALADSPVGLASWIVDRFHAWSETLPDRDDLLANIMLYWLTQTIGSSMAQYHAEATSPSLTPRDRVERPVGLALFPADIGGVPPRSFAERTLAVQRWTEMPRGGHFAALEQPALYARDAIEFFDSLGASS